MKIEIETEYYKPSNQARFPGMPSTFNCGEIARVGQWATAGYIVRFVNYRGGVEILLNEAGGEQARVLMTAPKDAPLKSDALNGILTALFTQAAIGGVDADGLRYAATELGGRILS